MITMAITIAEQPNGGVSVMIVHDQRPSMRPTPAEVADWRSISAAVDEYLNKHNAPAPSGAPLNADLPDIHLVQWTDSRGSSFTQELKSFPQASDVPTGAVHMDVALSVVGRETVFEGVFAEISNANPNPNFTAR